MQVFVSACNGLSGLRPGLVNHKHLHIECCAVLLVILSVNTDVCTDIVLLAKFIVPITECRRIVCHTLANNGNKPPAILQAEKCLLNVRNGVFGGVFRSTSC